jgi:hypothetical protein
MNVQNKLDCDLFCLALTSYILHFESSRSVYPQFQAKFAPHMLFCQVCRLLRFANFANGTTHTCT